MGLDSKADTERGDSQPEGGVSGGASAQTSIDNLSVFDGTPLPSVPVSEAELSVLSYGEIKELLQNLIEARGPCGEEQEVARVCREELGKICDEVTDDMAGNVTGVIRAGHHKREDAPPVFLMAHMDELSLIVKRVEDDGRLVVEPLGGLLPANCGQGPMEVLGEQGIVPGVLSFGSMHVTEESKAWQLKPNGGNKAVDWRDVHIETRLSPAELRKQGVHAGSRVVLSQSSRNIQEVGDCLSGFFMDNRAAIASMIYAGRLIRELDVELVSDVYLIATTNEELNSAGASYAARNLPDGLLIALDVAPVASEYKLELTGHPVVVYKDSVGVYDKNLSNKLVRTGESLGMAIQCAVVDSYSSDGSISSLYGHSSNSALLCLPTLNTHGCEMIHKESIANLARLLASFVKED